MKGWRPFGGERMRRIQDSRPVALALVSALALALSATPAAAADPAASMLDRPAPSFRLTDVRSGKTVSLEDMRGRTVVLHFGASW
jgi:cytochrome oxidase Cu insertion factor (SCO1/SenC/PrrC family)